MFVLNHGQPSVTILKLLAPKVPISGNSPCLGGTPCLGDLVSETRAVSGTF